MTTKLKLTFPAQTATKPLSYHLVKDYDLTFNIFQARISPGLPGSLRSRSPARKAISNRESSSCAAKGSMCSICPGPSIMTASPACIAAHAPPCAPPKRCIWTKTAGLPLTTSCACCANTASKHARCPCLRSNTPNSPWTRKTAGTAHSSPATCNSTE